MRIEENKLLAPLTTFQIGGTAAFYIKVTTQEGLEEAVVFAKAKGLPKLILGGGSNVLIDDAGFPGLVMHIDLLGIEDEGDVLVAYAGEEWDKLVERVVSAGLWGIENLSGIPGTMGGAVVQNIGAYGAALSEVLLWVDALDTNTNEVARYTNTECSFGYRDSLFKHNPDLVVLRAALKLSKEPKPNTSYKDLAALFTDSSLDIRAIRQAVITIRKGKFPDLTVEGTAGSFFKNPIVSVDEAAVLKQTYPAMPLFAMPETAGVKVPIAWLMDHVLHMHGLSIGGARLYEKQILVVVAKFGTPASEVIALTEKIKSEVKNKLQITIEDEVKVIHR